MITSPSFKPALSAGPPGVTPTPSLLINAPLPVNLESTEIPIIG